MTIEIEKFIALYEQERNCRLLGSVENVNSTLPANWEGKTFYCVELPPQKPFKKKNNRIYFFLKKTKPSPLFLVGVGD